MRALGECRSAIVQEAADGWSIYVRADPGWVAEIAAAVGLAGCRAIDESELVAAGISHP